MMYCGSKLFFVVFQKRICLYKFYYAYFLHVTKLYHLTKFQMPVSEIREFNRKKEKKKTNNSSYFNLTPFPQSKWTHFLTKLSF